MKLCAKFLIVLLLVAFAAPSFAIEPAVRNAGLVHQSATFDHVEKITMLQIGATAVLTPKDAVSTNTAAVYYLPDDVTYPIELEIQNETATAINYDIYSTTAAAGVNVPVSTDPILYDVNGAKCVSSRVAKMVFYQEPNICFSAASAATATFIIRSIKGEE
ncbi:MAG TPA: hypothetical protein PKC25_05130 [Candidatus Rifleibacterium sp.]|nr:hypothetical protein [Candidatus Rifleibacterium sp.]